MIPRKLKKQVLSRDPECVIAGPRCTRVSVDADHRAGRGSGGSPLLDDIRNLIGSCRACNGWKEDVVGPARERLIERGVRVEKASTNAATLLRAAATPVIYPDGTERWLT